MSRAGRRTSILLASAAVIGGLIPAAATLLNAQVRKCFLEVCSTKNGVTMCYEKEVDCPPPQPT
jgi:hypothetical protein